MRGATKNQVSMLIGNSISIHTPHAGSDVPQKRSFVRYQHFNPHSPCGERLLQSNELMPVQHFNPHSPCGERPEVSLGTGDCLVFQSTLPMRGATMDFEGKDAIVRFQSTLPMRGATLPIMAII